MYGGGGRWEAGTDPCAEQGARLAGALQAACSNARPFSFSLAGGWYGVQCTNFSSPINSSGAVTGTHATGLNVTGMHVTGLFPNTRNR